MQLSQGYVLDTKALVHSADAFARQLPGVSIDQSFGAGWATYKLQGKVFMLMTEVESSTTVIVKADPIRAAVLRRRYAEISAAQRMSKQHWISIVAGKNITKALLEREIQESYWLIQKSLPKKRVQKTEQQGTASEKGVSRRQLQPLARRLAAAMPGVSHNRPFVEKLDVYKVVNKVFLIVTDDPDERIITVKTPPEQIDVLCGTYETLTPGRYLDKHHWVSVEGGKGITQALVQELIEQSYRLALEAVPKRSRPPD